MIYNGKFIGYIDKTTVYHTVCFRMIFKEDYLSLGIIYDIMSTKWI